MHKKSQQGNRYSAIEEISQQLVPLFAENTLRVELHPFEIPFTMANAHDLLRLAPGGHLKAVGQRRRVNHQRMVARDGSAQPTAGTGYELDAIAAVVLGGTSLAGGKGRIVGTLIGALILGFLNNGLNLLGVSSYYQMIVKAVVILLAVLVDNKKQ